MSDRAFEFTGIHHVQLAMPPGEEEAAMRFYGGLLGLDLFPKPESLAPRGGLWFRGEGVEVHLGLEENFAPAVRAHPAFLVSGLERVRARLEAAGLRIDEDVQLAGYQRFYVRDPFGNRLELIEPA